MFVVQLLIPRVAKCEESSVGRLLCLVSLYKCTPQAPQSRTEQNMPSLPLLRLSLSLSPPNWCATRYY